MSFISAIKQKFSSHKHMVKGAKCKQCGKYFPKDQLFGGVCLKCINKLEIAE